MRRRTFARRYYNAIVALQAFIAFFAVLVAACMRADATYWKVHAPALGNALVAVQMSGPVTLIVFTLTAAALSKWKSAIGSAWLWSTVHHFLNTFRSDVFDGAGGEAEYRHRVTLFKRNRFLRAGLLLRGGGWIRPVERSGISTHLTRTAFRACDDPDRSEGIAGQTWSQNCTLIRRDLPNVFRDADPSSEDVRKYAKLTWTSEQWVRENRPRSRALLGLPLEVRNEPWGVVVLDSMDPNALDNLKPQQYQPFLKYLGKLLERA